MLTIIFKYIFALIFILSGCMHFILPAAFVKIMPSYLPFQYTLVLISGALELVFGVGLLLKKYQRLSAWGLIGLLIAVFPANINMYINAEDFPDCSETALLVRLPVQGLLVLWAYAYTRSALKD